MGPPAGPVDCRGLAAPPDRSPPPHLPAPGHPGAVRSPRWAFQPGRKPPRGRDDDRGPPLFHKSMTAAGENRDRQGRTSVTGSPSSGRSVDPGWHGRGGTLRTSSERPATTAPPIPGRSEEHTSELQSPYD